jgi:hypothetical protein
VAQQLLREELFVDLSGTDLALAKQGLRERKPAIASSSPMREEVQRSCGSNGAALCCNGTRI